MPSLEEQLAELQTVDPQTEKIIAGEDPYSFIPDVFGQLANTAITANNASLKDRLVAGLLTGLVGGFGSGLSKEYQNDTANTYQDLLTQSIGGEPVVNQGQLPDSVFRRLENQSKLFKIRQAKEDADLLKAAAIKDPVGLIESQALFPNLIKGAVPETLDIPKTEALPSKGDMSIPTDANLGQKIRERAIKNLNDYGGNKSLELALEKEKGKPWFDKIPATTMSSLTQLKGVTKELNTIADRFDAYKNREDFSWAKFQFNKRIAGTEANKLYTQVLKLVPTAARLGGEVGNLAQNEQDRIIDTTLGNLTSGPGDIAERLRELADSSIRIGTEKLETFKTGFEQGGDALLGQLNQAGGKSSPTEDRRVAARAKLRALGVPGY